MKINEIAQRVGITPKNIRFYEQEGLLSPRRDRENGYRCYDENDEAILRRIKLMRKLGLPLEDIRQMQSGRLPLSEGMRRQLASLGRQQRDLAVAQELCSLLLDEGGDFNDLDADRCLQAMELKEREGAQFADRQQLDRRGRSRAAILAAVVFALLMLAVIGLTIWAELSDPIPVWLLLLILAIPAALILGVGLALAQRLREIESGEEEDAKRY